MPTLIIPVKTIAAIPKTSQIPHPFYGWLTQQFNRCVIIECGTARGGSAKSWGSNPTNIVLTFDIRIKPSGRIDSRPNVFYKILDCNDLNPELVSQASIIYLDISHNGDDEERFMKLIASYFKGILVMDDIDCHSRWAKLYDLFNGLEREHHLLPKSIGTGRGTGVVPYGDWTVEIKEEL